MPSPALLMFGVVGKRQPQVLILGDITENEKKTPSPTWMCGRGGGGGLGREERRLLNLERAAFRFLLIFSLFVWYRSGHSKSHYTGINVRFSLNI